jgi:hypothetical protein
MASVAARKSGAPHRAAKEKTVMLIVPYFWQAYNIFVRLGREAKKTDNPAAFAKGRMFFAWEGWPTRRAEKAVKIG